MGCQPRVRWAAAGFRSLANHIEHFPADDVRREHVAAGGSGQFRRGQNGRHENRTGVQKNLDVEIIKVRCKRRDAIGECRVHGGTFEPGAGHGRLWFPAQFPDEFPRDPALRIGGSQQHDTEGVEKWDLGLGDQLRRKIPIPGVQRKRNNIIDRLHWIHSEEILAVVRDGIKSKVQQLAVCELIGIIRAGLAMEIRIMNQRTLPLRVRRTN